VKNIFQGDFSVADLIEGMLEVCPDLTVPMLRQLLSGMEWSFIDRTGAIKEAQLPAVVRTDSDARLEWTIGEVKRQMAMLSELAPKSDEENMWVPVNERKPENRKWVMISNGNHIEIAMYKHGKFMYDDLKPFNASWAITHWRPMPEPPKA
jgi:hypothetical protein